MPVRRGSQGSNKLSSERDVALVQMQIAAQSRNQQWHDFLCRKRDALQARLRQQGYSDYSHHSQNLQEMERESDYAGGNGAVPEREITAPQRSSPRSGVPAEVSAPGEAVEHSSTSEDIDNIGIDVKGLA